MLTRSFLVLAALLGVSIISLPAATLEVVVQHEFHGELLRLDSLRYQNAADEMLSFTRISCLMTAFALQRADGTWLEMPGKSAWMDAEKERLSVRFEDLPEGKYRGLRFHIGPDAVANAADTDLLPANHPLKPELNNLYWSREAGYIFLAVEGRYQGMAAEPHGYAYHLARNPQRTPVSLSGDIDLSHDAAVLVGFDLGSLFKGPRPLSFARQGSFSHSDPGDAIAAALVANLPAAFHLAQPLPLERVLSRATTAASLILQADSRPAVTRKQ